MNPPIRKYKALSDLNRVVGESHGHAKLSNEEVELIRTLHEEGFVGYRALARAFGVSRSTIQSICNYRRRSTTAARYIEVKIIPGK